MNKKRMLVLLFSVILVIGIASGCGSANTKTNTSSPASSAASTPASTPAKTKIEPMKLQLGHVNPPTDDDQYQKFATNFAKNISDATGGAVTVEIFGSSQLGGERDMLEGMKMGTMDIAILSNLIYAGVNPESNIVELPFFFKDRQTAYKFLDGEIMKGVTDKMQKSLSVVILGWAEGGFRNVVNNVRPITKPEDMKGIKIRVPESPMFVKTFKALGANPTPIAFSETFTAIQQKTVDGLELPIPSIFTGHYNEICKYLSLTGHFYNALTMTVSKSKWDSMSPELQKMFTEATVKAGKDQRVFVQENDQKQLDQMTKAGLKVNSTDIDINAMKEAVKPIYEEYRNTIGAELYDKALNAIK